MYNQKLVDLEILQKTKFHYEKSKAKYQHYTEANTSDWDIAYHVAIQWPNSL